jgi:Ca-activated chloride channel family protein
MSWPFSFASPWYLLILIALPAIVAFAVAVDRRRSRYPVAFTNLALLAQLVERHQRAWRRWVPVALLVLALATATAALAQPHANVSVPDQNATVVLLVDVSGSMKANDVEPSRLDAAVDAMTTFLNRLPKQFKVGLVAFSSESEPLAEPTSDRASIEQALGYLQPEAGTAIGDGLETAVKMVQRSMARAGVVKKPGQDLPAAIVLLSDGAQNRGTLQPLQAAHNAKVAGIRVYTVALGTPNGTVAYGFGLYVNHIPVPPDPPTMHAIAKATGGQTFTARTASSVSHIYKTLGSSIGRKEKNRAITSWFAAVSAGLLAAALGAAVFSQARLP